MAAEQVVAGIFSIRGPRAAGIRARRAPLCRARGHFAHFVQPIECSDAERQRRSKGWDA